MSGSDGTVLRRIISVTSEVSLPQNLVIDPVEIIAVFFFWLSFFFLMNESRDETVNEDESKNENENEREGRGGEGEGEEKK